MHLGFLLTTAVECIPRRSSNAMMSGPTAQDIRHTTYMHQIELLNWQAVKGFSVGIQVCFLLLLMGICWLKGILLYLALRPTSHLPFRLFLV